MVLAAVAGQSVGIKIGLPRLNNNRRVLHLETTACGIQAGLYEEKTFRILLKAKSGFIGSAGERAQKATEMY